MAEKISDLIKRLEGYRGVHGDLPVMFLQIETSKLEPISLCPHVATADLKEIIRPGEVPNRQIVLTVS